MVTSSTAGGLHLPILHRHVDSHQKEAGSPEEGPCNLEPTVLSKNYPDPFQGCFWLFTPVTTHCREYSDFINPREKSLETFHKVGTDINTQRPGWPHGSPRMGHMRSMEYMGPVPDLAHEGSTGPTGARFPRPQVYTWNGLARSFAESSQWFRDLWVRTIVVRTARWEALNFSSLAKMHKTGTPDPGSVGRDSCCPQRPQRYYSPT